LVASEPVVAPAAHYRLDAGHRVTFAERAFRMSVGKINCYGGFALLVTDPILSPSATVEHVGARHRSILAAIAISVGQRVRPSAPEELVTSASPVKIVLSGAGDESIVARATVEDVGVGSTKQLIVPRPALDEIEAIPAAGEELIVSISAVSVQEPGLGGKRRQGGRWRDRELSGRGFGEAQLVIEVR